MANGFGTGGPGGTGSSGGTKGGAQSGSTGKFDWASISPLLNPDFMKLFQQAQSSVPTEMQSLQQMIQGGMQSPLLQAVLGPALQRLQAPQQLQQQQFTEAARASGGLRGSTYGQGLNTLMQNQGQQQNDLMGQVIQQVLGQLVQGQLQEQRNQFLPAESFTNLLRTIRPELATSGQRATSGSSGWENIPPSLGLGTPMQGSTMGPAGGVNTMMGGGGSMQAHVGPTGQLTSSPSVSQPPPQYVDPWSGGYGAIDSPFTSPAGQPGGSAYQHDYSDWTNLPAQDGWY